MAVPYVNNIVINAGSDFSQPYTIYSTLDFPINLAGYSAASMMRKHAESSVVVANFDVTFVDRFAGEIQISLGSSITKNIKEGRYVYDIMMIDSKGSKSIAIEGMVLVRTGIST